MTIQINHELKNLIPPLTTEEYKSLKLSLLNEGCRDALVLWNNTIVDGHNRFEICNKYNIEFRTTSKEFKDINEAKRWIINNQLGRRNISEYSRIKLVMTLDSILEFQQKAKERMLIGSNPEAEPPQGRTRKKIAETAETTEWKVKQFQKIEKEADEETKQKLISGELSMIEVITKNNIRGIQQTGEYEWYTPPEYIEAARKTMGSIDLDPASCEFANQNIQATTIYTEKDDGLVQPWYGNVWLNPPFARGLIDNFSDKVIQELFNINQLIMICHNSTETTWLQQLIINSDIFCLLKNRVRFYKKDKNGNKITPNGSSLQGQLILYFGKNTNKFYENFKEFGICVKKIE